MYTFIKMYFEVQSFIVQQAKDIVMALGMNYQKTQSNTPGVITVIFS